VGTTQSPVLTASTNATTNGTGYNGDTQTETVTPKLAITSSAFSVATGVCSPLTVATEDNSNNLVSPPKAMTVNLSVTGSSTGRSTATLLAQVVRKRV